MNEITSRKQTLEQKIDELEDTLAKLKQALKREVETEQHEAIDQLEIYFERVNNKFTNLQDFWQLLREEIGALLRRKYRKK
jgi:chaperonin cofactor prefoldin